MRKPSVIAIGWLTACDPWRAACPPSPSQPAEGSADSPGSSPPSGSASTTNRTGHVTTHVGRTGHVTGRLGQHYATLFPASLITQTYTICLLQPACKYECLLCI